MAKRVGRPTNVPFGDKLDQHRNLNPTSIRSTVSPRHTQFLKDAESHNQELKAGGITLPEYGAKRREAINAFQTGKPPYAFRPKGDT